MNRPNIANIVLSNLDTLTENTLAYFINSNLCQNAKLALSQNNIHIYILDLDRKYDEYLIQNVELHQQHIIGIHLDSEQNPLSNRMTLVKKPLNVSELTKAIDKVHQELFKPPVLPTPNKETKTKHSAKIKHKDQTHRNLYNAIDEEKNEDDIHLRYKAQRYVGNNEDVDPQTDDLQKIYINAENYFFSSLLEALSAGQSNRSTVGIKTSLGTMIYHYKENLISHDIEKNKLKLLQTTPLINQASKFSLNSSPPFKEHVMDAISFAWDTVIQTSKGRLPENTNLIKPVILLTWPNFTKLRIFRHAIPITALWSRQRISLVETAKLLVVPQRYVFSLYGAMNALGYAKIGKFEDEVTQKSKVIKPLSQQNNSNFFSKIMSHLFKRK